MATTNWKANIRFPTMESINFKAPPATSGLPFLRKAQSLDSLNSERPKSTVAARAVFSIAIDDAHRRLKLLERNFYGAEFTMDEYLRRWAAPCKQAMRATRIGDLRSMIVFHDINLNASSAGAEIKADNHTLALLRDSIDKALEHVPSSFEVIRQEIKSIQAKCAKYLQSFRPGLDTDPLLDPITHYDMTIKEISNTISNNFKIVDGLPFKFRYSGMSLTDFSLTTQETARRCEIQYIPHLLLFPEACERMRICFQALRKWIDSDEQYVTFLKFDIKEIEGRIARQEIVARESQELVFQAEYKVTRTSKDIAESQRELNTLKSRENDWVQKQLTLESIESEINLNIEVKHMRLENMRITERRGDRGTDGTSSSADRDGFDLKMKQIESELRSLKREQPAAVEKLGNVNSKLKWLKTKQTRLRGIKSLHARLDLELKKMRRMRDADQFELRRLSRSLSQLKHTLMLKTSGDIVKRLFHSMHIETRPPGLTAHTLTDQLDRACRVVEKEIDTDWGKLYRNLPFNPPRGEANILADVDEIGQSCMRAGAQQHAKTALARWRRFHTRASVDDLTATLTRIKQADLSKAVQESLKQKKQKKPRHHKLSSVNSKNKAAWMAHYETNPLLQKARQLPPMQQVRYSMGRVVLDSERR